MVRRRGRDRREGEQHRTNEPPGPRTLDPSTAGVATRQCGGSPETLPRGPRATANEVIATADRECWNELAERTCCCPTGRANLARRRGQSSIASRGRGVEFSPPAEVRTRLLTRRTSSATACATQCSPASKNSAARCVFVTSVCGCSGPRTSSWTASISAYRRRAAVATSGNAGRERDRCASFRTGDAAIARLVTLMAVPPAASVCTASATRTTRHRTSLRRG